MDKFKRHVFLSFSSILSWLVFALIFISTSVIFAQQKQVKKDSLEIIEGVSGLVEYEYNTSKGEDIYDGKFSFQSVSPSKLKSFDFKSIIYEGEFSSNQKSGNWSFSDKIMKEENQKFVSGFRVGKFASGTENKISGKFQNGKAVGNWEAVKQDYVNSEVKDTLFFIESTFKNNRLVGSLKSTSKSIIVQGYFNADGYFHGDWEIKHQTDDKPVREIRTYEAGILKTYEFVIDNKTFDVSYSAFDTTVSRDDEHWKDYTLEEGYFDILNLVDLDVEQSVSSSIKVSVNNYHKKSNEFIKNSVLAFSHQSGFDIWNSIRGSDPLELGKFKVRKFDFTEEEKKKIQSIAENFANIQSVLKRFSENPKVKIGKPVYEKFNEAELIFNVYRNELTQLERMVHVITSDAFEFVDRKEIYGKIWPKLLFPVEVTYEFQSELITQPHEFPKVPERQNFDLEKANYLIKSINEDVVALYKEVDKIFKAMEIEKSLSRDEERLVEKKLKIENLFDLNSKKEGFNAYHERYSELVLKLTEDTFNAYGNLKINEKKNRIKGLLNCYDNLIEFYIFLKDLKSKDERLDDAYTRITFNPYMMVDMSERIKENIYKAFDESLKPYLVNRLSNNFSCETIESAMENINHVYQKMLELSKRDTKEEERELRRQKDPEAILSVLELKLKY
ncbi:MAG: hypothetical protein R6V36_07195 [Psychroflexus sp.]